MSRDDVTDQERDALRKFVPPERSGKPGRLWADLPIVLSGIVWNVTVNLG